LASAPRASTWSFRAALFASTCREVAGGFRQDDQQLSLVLCGGWRTETSALNGVKERGVLAQHCSWLVAVHRATLFAQTDLIASQLDSPSPAPGTFARHSFGQPGAVQPPDPWPPAGPSGWQSPGPAVHHM
jgi:hypothetical protein